MKTYVNNFPDDIRHVDYIEIDEMWHFTLKKNENSGSGLPLTDIHRKSLVFLLGVEVKKTISL